MTEKKLEKLRQLAETTLSQDIVLTGLLRQVVAEFGYIDDEFVPIIADVYNLSKAEVFGVITFYHDFRRTKAGENIIRICQAEACQAVGSRQLTKAVQDRLDIELGETTKDDEITLEPVYCLGLCACGPAAQVNDRLIAFASSEELIDLAKSKNMEKSS